MFIGSGATYHSANAALIYRRTPKGLIQMSGAAYNQMFPGEDWRKLSQRNITDAFQGIARGTGKGNNYDWNSIVDNTGSWTQQYSTAGSDINEAWNPETAGIYGQAMQAQAAGSNLANTPMPWLANTPEALKNQKLAMQENATPPTSALQPGATGQNVKQLQDWLVKGGNMTQEQVDTGYGTYGPQTTAAVKALQKKLGIDAGAGAGFFGQKTMSALKSPYAQGFTGTRGEAPTSSAEGMAAVNKLMPSAAEPSVVDSLMQSDTEFQGFFQQWQKGMQDYFSPKNQKMSLVNEYKALLKESGIEGIDAELINDKKVIEGTEDDIRNEVMKAGGFATDSQVQALSAARNKTLIKNYNTLLETRNSKASYLDNVMKLSAQDRTEANQQFDKMMDFGFKVMDYRDKMQKNSTDAYNKIVQNAGYDGLLKMTNGDRHATSIIEKTLGLSSGGLQSLATQAAETRAIDLQEKSLDFAIKKANLANIYSQIADRDAQNNVATDPFGKVIVKPVEAMKINKELVNSDSYKAIQKGRDSLQFLTSFEDKFNKTGATSAVFSPRQNADLKARYNTAILNLKEFFNLGVLNGPDEAILRSVLPDPTNRSAFLTTASLGIYKPSAGTKAGIDNMKKMIEASLDERFTSLSAQYGDYSTGSVGSLNDLNRSYIQQKSILNPQIKKLLAENPNLDINDILSIIFQ